MDGNGWEAIFSEDFIKLDSVLNAFHKDNNLVEH